MDIEKNRIFGKTITRLIQKENLTKEDAYQAFSLMLRNEVSELQQGGFLAALSAKGETAEEIAGGWQAVFEQDTNKAKINSGADVLDNCGTGMDSFKTFNISTAASIIGAAGGLMIARHGARAISSQCGTVDIAENLGVDVDCPVSTVAESIESTGIGLFNGMSPEVHPRALGRILSQMNFGSPLNIAASLANPAMPRLGVRGVFSKQMLKPVVSVMKEIGYRRAIVIHGRIGRTDMGIDEASICGMTYGYQLKDGEVSAMEFSPESVGLKNHEPAQIASRSSLENASLHMVRLLAGLEKGACEDIVLLNSAMLFLASDKVKTVEDGIDLSRSLIKEGKALDKLKQWVSAQNSNPQKGIAALQGYLQTL